MTDLLNTFLSIYHRDFRWPHPLPVVSRPSRPPINTGARFFPSKPDPDDGEADPRAFHVDKLRYKQLATKERRLQDELITVDREMTNLTSRILESSCESDDEAMRTIYEIDYQKRGLPVTRYRPLMAAADAPDGSPIAPVTTKLEDGYRDPTRFRYSALERPTIQPAKTINLLAVPETISSWYEPFTGRSEYIDTVSKMGLSNMKNRQQYLEPLPSSRRRFGDSAL